MIEGWKKITFTQHYPKTDLFRYKAMSYLLVPEKGEINRFVMWCSRNNITFYICSTSLGSLQMMESFFTRLYPCRTDTVSDPLADKLSIKYNVVMKIRRKAKTFYYPTLVQNLSMIAASTQDAEIGNEVILMNKNDKGYAMVNRIHVAKGNADTRKLVAQIRNIYKTAKIEAKIKVKMIGNEKPVLLRRKFNADPSHLMNFIRITEDERLI
ncbi:MAG: hypothetical protein AMDU2_EPLC00015G0005 [Thermoplasmatales archaeon E-plasma]|nr:MAG: hypothetical protein AMDU2_EPLC00015G0005 [Thermoplasmatales archaeon E-plasma]